MIEKNVIESGIELEMQYMSDDNRSLIQYINKNIGLGADNMSMIVGFGEVGGSSTASLEIYLLDSEKRPQNIRSSMLASLIREKTGDIVGAEKFIVNDAANFGGSPVSISIMSNNVDELKKAKNSLLNSLRTNPQLTDVTHNDPLGSKEINIKLKENAELLGFDIKKVMAQIRYSFFGLEIQKLQRGDEEIKVWLRFDKNSREFMELVDQKLMKPFKNYYKEHDLPMKDLEDVIKLKDQLVQNDLEGHQYINRDFLAKYKKEHILGISQIKSCKQSSFAKFLGL